MPEHTPAPTPSRAVYGFAMFLSFKIFFMIYIVWAVIPEEWFRFIGITYLPKRHWAVTVPIFVLIVLGLFAFVIYPNMRYFNTPNPSDLRTIRDSISVRNIEKPQKFQKSEKNSECCCVNKKNCCKSGNIGDFEGRTIPVARDINIWDASELLYLRKK